MVENMLKHWIDCIALCSPFFTLSCAAPMLQRGPDASAMGPTLADIGPPFASGGPELGFGP